MSQSTLDRARGGSEQAFRELVEPWRRELHLHCYRMLGSLADAEDILQEAMLAAWRGLDGFAGRSSLRTWLYRIATNRCLNALRDSRRRVPAEPVAPFEVPPPSVRSTVTWLQPYPDALLEQSDFAGEPVAGLLSRETVELAFVAALQELPPRQVATLLLSDVLGFSNTEVAAMLDTTVTGMKGVLQRARASVVERRDLRARTHRPESSTQERDLARRFAQAFCGDDIDAVIELLTDDAWLSMPPAPHEYQGPAAIRAFLQSSARWRAGRALQLFATRANRQPAFGYYFAEHKDAPACFSGVIVITVAGGGISGVTRFLDPGLRAAFGFPATTAGRSGLGPAPA